MSIDMSQLGQVRIGHKAPDFHCEAIVEGSIKSEQSWKYACCTVANALIDVSLSTFIRSSTSPGTLGPNAPWLLLLFVPAAFSSAHSTEIMAFQSFYGSFRDRYCSVAFVSVDTKYSLWQWQNLLGEYGGLGSIDIPLLSDVTHKIGRDYGVLVEQEGVNLRGMFLIDGEGIVQQVCVVGVTQCDLMLVAYAH